MIRAAVLTRRDGAESDRADDPDSLVHHGMVMNSFSDTYEVRHTRPAASLTRRPETPDPQISTRPKTTSNLCGVERCGTLANA